MLQLNFVFDVIIHPRRITVSESFYIIRYEITENVRFSLNNSTWELISLPSKGFFILKDLISKFIVSTLAFL